MKASFASRESLCERIEGGVVSSDEAGSVRQNAAAIIPPHFAFRGSFSRGPQAVPEQLATYFVLGNSRGDCGHATDHGLFSAGGSGFGYGVELADDLADCGDVSGNGPHFGSGPFQGIFCIKTIGNHC